MKLISLYFYIAILLCLSSRVHSQIITIPSNPVSTQTQYLYTFEKGLGISFSQWIVPTNLNKVVDMSGFFYPNQIYELNLYLKWYNVEDNASPSIIKAEYFDHGIKYWIEKSVGPFTLNMPVPTFSSGSSLTISNATSPVTISLIPYINTANNGIDKDLTITSHFEWTLPSGWQTTGNETGTFVSGPSIVVIPPSSICTETISVKAYANGQKSDPATIQINRYIPIDGPDIICSSGATYAISNPPTGCTFEWTAGPNLSISSGQNTSSCTFTSSGNESSWISAILVTSCGSITLPVKNVWIGIPPYPVITSITPYEWSTAYGYPPAKEFTIIGPDISLNDENYENSFANSFTWEWSSDNVPAIYNKVNGEILFMPNEPGVVRIRTKVSNTCGETELSASVFVYIPEGFLMAPNPASDNLTIIIKAKKQIEESGATSMSTTSSAKYIVRIFSFVGIKNYEATFNGKNFTVPLGNLREGNYFVEVNDGRKSYRKQLVIKR